MWVLSSGPACACWDGVSFRSRGNTHHSCGASTSTGPHAWVNKWYARLNNFFARFTFVWFQSLYAHACASSNVLSLKAVWNTIHMFMALLRYGRACACSRDFVTKWLKHTSQTWGFNFRWTVCVWWDNVLVWVNDLSQVSHLYGFSPVCTHMLAQILRRRPLFKTYVTFIRPQSRVHRACMVH